MTKDELEQENIRLKEKIEHDKYMVIKFVEEVLDKAVELPLDLGLHLSIQACKIKFDLIKK